MYTYYIEQANTTKESKMSAILKYKHINMFDLIVDGVVVSTNHNKHHFDAHIMTADKKHYDMADVLGLVKKSYDEYAVTNLDAFLAWADADAKIVDAPVKMPDAYYALQNEGYIEPKFTDNTPSHKTDY